MSWSLHLLCPALALPPLIHKVRVLRRDRSDTNVALVAYFFFLAVMFAAAAPGPWVALTGCSGLADLSRLVARGCVVALAAAQQFALLGITHGPAAPRKARPRLLAVTAGLAVMAVLFAWNAPRNGDPSHSAVARATETPAYLAVYLVVLTANQVAVAIASRRCARIAPAPWLRRGLRLVALSLPLVLVCTAVRTRDIIASLSGAPQVQWEPVAQIAVVTAVFLQSVGWVLPDAGPLLTAAAERRRCRRRCRDLAAFHRTLTEHAPEPVIALPRPRDPRARLYRMAIEVRDAQWAMRAWMDPDVARAAREGAARAGLTGDAFGAAVEAVQLRGAMTALREGRRPPSALDSPAVAAPGDLTAELAHLARLSEAMTSPVVLGMTAAGGG